MTRMGEVKCSELVMYRVNLTYQVYLRYPNGDPLNEVVWGWNGLAREPIATLISQTFRHVHELIRLPTRFIGSHYLDDFTHLRD